MTPQKIYIFLAVALALSYALGRFHARYRISAFQNKGEALVTFAIQSNFAPPNYHLLNHVTLKLADGTTQIDHVLISRFGVFVIETKNYSGWIFANAKQATWTQVLFHKKFKLKTQFFRTCDMFKLSQPYSTFCLQQPSNLWWFLQATPNSKLKSHLRFSQSTHSLNTSNTTPKTSSP